jgi:hypothetical protein
MEDDFASEHESSSLFLLTHILPLGFQSTNRNQNFAFRFETSVYCQSPSLEIQLPPPKVYIDRSPPAGLCIM